MLNAPYTQTVMQQLASNPDLAQNIIGSNPLFAGNPALQEQMRAAMPTLLQQMQNPAVQVKSKGSLSGFQMPYSGPRYSSKGMEELIFLLIVMSCWLRPQLFMSRYISTIKHCEINLKSIAPIGLH